MTTSDIPAPSPLPGRLNLFCSPRSPFVRRVHRQTIDTL